MFLERHDVGHQLAGMAGFGQAVDHRNAGVRGQLCEFPDAIGAQHDGVDVAGQHARGVGHGFAAAQLHVTIGQNRDVAAKLAHGDLEADAGAGAGLFEQQRQRAAGERGAGVLPGLDGGGDLQDVA
jgi:hypothetical protein